MKQSWQSLFCMLIAASACSESTASSEPITSEKPAHHDPTSPPPPKADFMLMHYPALGIQSFVEVFRENGSQVVRVTRTVKRGFAAGWTLRFNGSAATRIDKLVRELSAGMGVASSCPRRHGRDGVSWVVRNLIQRVEWGIDFGMNDGGPACARLEAAAVELMRLAKLKCWSRVCLRPEEEASGTLTCATRESERECREGADGSD